MSHYETSRLSEDVPLTPMTEMTEKSQQDDSYAPNTLVRDSIITYSTEAGESSLATSTTTDVNYIEEEVVSRKSRQSTTRSHAPSEYFYHKKRFWAICVSVTVVLSAIFIPLLFLVIVPAVAQSAVNKSKIDFQSLNITQPTNDSFVMNMVGKAHGAGPFGATITFNGPVNILYEDRIIGSVELDSFEVSQGSGLVSGVNKTFKISDSTRFSELASKMLVVDSFEWTIQGSTNVRAFGTYTKNLTLNKKITILGSNGFISNLLDLKVIQTPENTLNLEVTANIFNPSPIGIELGNVTLQFGYGKTIMSTATAVDVFLVTKNNTLTMKGTASLPTTDEDRSNYVKVIEAYLTSKPINTTAKIISIVPKNGIPVDWLNLAVSNMPPISTVVGNVKAPELIKGIDFGQMNLKFTPDTAYSPVFSSKNVTANIAIPFNIDYKILSVKQKLSLYYKGKPVFEIETPDLPVTNTATELTLDMPESQMNVVSNDLFSDFLTTLTTTKGADVFLVGESNVNTTTIIGTAPIQGLAFNISSSFLGFNQFNIDGGSGPSVSNITVLGGTSDQIIISTIINLANPLKYSMSVGKVTLNSFYQGQKIGTVTINDLSIVPGSNYLSVLATLDDPANNNGIDLITSILSEQAATIDIKGFEGSTDIASLVQAFKAIEMSSTMLPIEQDLVTRTTFALDDQSLAANKAIGIAEITNVHEAPISIYTMNSTITFGGNVLGTIDQDLRNNPIFIPGKTVQIIQLPVDLYFDPAVLFSMTRNLALQNGLDVTVFDSLIALSGVNVPEADLNAKPTPDALRSFNLTGFITTALRRIPSTVDLESLIAIGDYIMPIKYKKDIYTETDASILKFLPKITLPMLEQLMNQTQVNLKSLFIHNIDVSSFEIDISGQVINTGPIAAQLSFPNGATVSSDNITLGTMLMSPLTADPVTGVNLNGTGKFIIADIPTFTSFAGKAFVTPNILYDMSMDIVIEASGLSIGPIPFKKSMNLPGLVTNQAQPISTSFLPGGQNGAINFATVIAINNPTITGIELGTVVYNLSVEDKQISTVTANNVIINPNGVSNITLQGSFTLTDTGLLGRLLGDNPPPLVVQGVSIQPPKATGEVVWLSTPFKSITLKFPFDKNTLLKQQ